MKTRTVASILILVLAVLIITGSCATDRKAYVAKENEELYGNWFNSEYNDSIRAARHIINADGTIQLHTTDDSPRVVAIHLYTITDKWYDSEGNIWYKQVWIYKTAYRTLDTIYEIVRISNSGKTLELIFSEYDFPKGITADHPHYRIYYRQ